MKAQHCLLPDLFWFQEGPGVRKWQFTSSGIKLLNVGNILSSGELDLTTTDRYLSRAEVEARYRHFLVEEGDLVIASSGISFDEDGLLRTRGAFVRSVHLPLCLNTSTIRFKPKRDTDLRYLRFWLDSHEFRSQITRLVTGSAQQNFGPSHLENVSITLPPLSEQRRIAGQLDQTDRLRRTRRYALELNNTFLPAAFLGLFGDHVRNPKNLRIAELDDFLSFVTSGSRGWAEYYVPNGDRFIRSLDVRMNHISDKDAVFVNAPEGTEADRARVRTGDVLLTITGSQIGRVAPVPPRIDGAFVSQHVAILRLKPGILPVFLSMFMSLESGGQRQIARLQYGQTKPGLSLGQIHEFKIPVPPLPLQKQFAVLVARHERLRAVQREALRQAEHLFQSLLHRAFTIRS
jgi:type I restriction enzyme S subunit